MARFIPLEESVLNDDCLREVFSYLEIDELCAAADTCQRFREIAQEIFQKKPEFTSTLNNNYFPIRRNLPRIIRIFGEWISSITMWSNYHCNLATFIHLAKNCGPQLKSLTFQWVYMDRDTYDVLQPVFYHLETLRLVDCETRPSILAYLPDWSPNLRTLKIIKSNLPDQTHRIEHSLHQKFPKLQNAVLTYIDIEDIKQFLLRNPQLTSLTCDKVHESIFPILARRVPNIEHLDFLQASHDPEPYIMYCLNRLGSLQSCSFRRKNSRNAPEFGPSNCRTLKKLKLEYFDFLDIGTKLTRLTNLSELHLDGNFNLAITHIMNVLSACIRLNTLTLHYNQGVDLSVDELIDILRRGTALKRFDYAFTQPIENPKIIDGNSYMRMIDILRARPDATLTQITLGTCSWSCAYVNNIPDEMLAQYKHVLKLVISDRY